MSPRPWALQVLRGIQQDYLRYNARRALSLQIIRTFSTTPQNNATKPGTKKPQGKSKRPLNQVATRNTMKERQRRNRNNKEVVERQALAEPGARKAFRKRIVLSNTNAIHVPGLQDLSKENMLSEDTRGRVLGFSDDLIDTLRILNAFKPHQNWNIFKKPAAVMRADTWELGKAMASIEETAPEAAEHGSNWVRKFIYGDRKTGKSVLLLQAMAMAYLRGWVVINIPEARELTNGHSEYAPLPGTNPTQYFQPAVALQLLQQLSKVNSKPLSKFKLTESYGIQAVQRHVGTPLNRVVEVGIHDRDFLWPAFQAIWSELMLSATSGGGAVSRPTTSNLETPPVLITIDNVSHLFALTHYHTVDKSGKLHRIHPFDFRLVKQLVNSLTGTGSFKSRGLVLGATSGSDFVKCDPIDIGIAMSEARKQGMVDVNVDHFWNPLKKIDRRVMDLMHNLDAQKLQGLTKIEARALIDYWAGSGMIPYQVDDSWLGHQWAVSGGGIIGELERTIVKSKF